MHFTRNVLVESFANTRKVDTKVVNIFGNVTMTVLERLNQAIRETMVDAK